MTQLDFSILKQRVQERLRDLDMTVAEATRRGRLPKDFIYDILNDRKKTVRSDNIQRLSLALDCDAEYLQGSQGDVSLVDNIVDFDRPPVPIVGSVEVGIYVDKSYTYSNARNAPDMPNLPPDTRFPSSAQVDLYVRGNSIDRFAPNGYILRCVLIDNWNELIKPGDMLVVDRFQGTLRERAAWRVHPTSEYIDFETDTDQKKEQVKWRIAARSVEGGWMTDNQVGLVEPFEDDKTKPYAVVIFAYALPRIRRMF